MLALAFVLPASAAAAAPTNVTSSHPDVAFGLVAANQVADVTVTLTADASGDPMSLDDLRLGVGALGLAPVGLSIVASTCDDAIEPSTSCAVTVRFAPTGERSYTAELVVGDAPLYRQVFARISGTGYIPPTPAPPVVWPPVDETTGEEEGSDETPRLELRGTDEADEWRGGSSDETYRASSGADRLWGGSGIDRLFGDAGNDTIRGGNGNDVVDGGAGRDRLYGERGNDRLVGGSGNDVLDGGVGRDRIDGGAGNDVIYARDRARDVVRCGTGRDRVVADRSDVLVGCERVSRR